MQITRTARPVRQKADVKMWHCGGCGVVHMSLGKMVLNFDRDEFADLTDAVIDLSTKGWLDGERYFSIVELVAGEDEPILHSGESIH